MKDVRLKDVMMMKIECLLAKVWPLECDEFHDWHIMVYS